jgi:multiple sugar transport system permease protein
MADRPLRALAYIVLIMVLAITNIYVKYLNKVKER